MFFLLFYVYDSVFFWTWKVLKLTRWVSLSRAAHLKFATKKNTSAESSTARQNKSGQNKKNKGNKGNSKEIKHAPTAVTKQAKTSAPKITGGNGSVRVRHREYLFDVPGNSQWNIFPFSINPGLSAITWLNQLANLYESYLFHSLKFNFESTSPTTERGSVMLAIDFDAADDPPSGKQEIMAMQGAVRSAPWESVVYNATAQNLSKFGVQRYVRSGVLNSNLDIKTYDVGKFYCAVQGTSAVTSIGEIYVDYDVTFYTPQSSNALIIGLSAKLTFADSLLPGNPFGSGPQSYTGGLPVRYRDANSLWIDRVGSYLFSFSFSGTGMEDLDLFTVSVNGSASGPYGSTSVLLPVETNDSNFMTVTQRVDIKQLGAYVTCILSNVTSVTGTTLRISAYDYALG